MSPADTGARSHPASLGNLNWNRIPDGLSTIVDIGSDGRTVAEIENNRP
jgi:hypothetical protein